ncbi:methyl-accepting chemotaxis protein [Nitrincola sp. A-D6]|uniref:methyl-accepting chemotaxis protein n=1 Tax=Nitrincola sp. A-D6 TaxID=1545442 RepID=UPI000B3272FB|nr:methyl-accepting chemotaxis protein [Nitrincola sp. A-D6]
MIRQVKQSSSDIASVLDVIKGIAEQTNLLALNAAIEAARAGDTGRGFAVVADEVRSLASRTQASTENIREMIDALESGSTRAVAVMEAGERHAEDCVGQGQLTVAALDDIYHSIQGIRDMSTQIATAVEQQSQVAEEINRSISSIRQSSESNLGLVEESKVTSGGVLGVANRFEELAAQFWARQGVL